MKNLDEAQIPIPFEQIESFCMRNESRKKIHFMDIMGINKKSELGVGGGGLSIFK